MARSTVGTGGRQRARAGESGAVCGGCAAVDEDAIWANERWRFRSKERTSIPGTVILETRDHLDSFTSLSSVHLAEFGPLVAAVERCLLDLGDVSRVHISAGETAAPISMYTFTRGRVAICSCAELFSRYGNSCCRQLMISKLGGSRR